MCVTFVTCEVRVCGLHCRSGSSLYIYRVYLLTYLLACVGIQSTMVLHMRVNFTPVTVTVCDV